jgi:hypothetical protein
MEFKNGPVDNTVMYAENSWTHTSSRSANNYLKFLYKYIRLCIVIRGYIKRGSVSK